MGYNRFGAVRQRAHLLLSLTRHLALHLPAAIGRHCHIPLATCRHCLDHWHATLPYYYIYPGCYCITTLPLPAWTGPPGGRLLREGQNNSGWASWARGTATPRQTTYQTTMSLGGRFVATSLPSGLRGSWLRSGLVWLRLYLPYHCPAALDVLGYIPTLLGILSYLAGHADRSELQASAFCVSYYLLLLLSWSAHCTARPATCLYVARRDRGDILLPATRSTSSPVALGILAGARISMHCT